MTATDAHGRTTAERQARRQASTDQVIAAAARAWWPACSGRCQAALRYGHGQETHGLCQGESRGGVGCLCPCHDPIADVISGDAS